MKEKKIVTIILLFIVLIGVSTISNAADTYTATTQTSEGLTVNWNYQLEGDNIVNLVCTNISEISGKVDIPSSIEGKNVTIYGNEGSFAEQYAKTNGIKFDLISNYGKPNEEKPGNENNTPSEENKDNYQGEQNIGNDKKPNEGLANSGSNTPQNGQDVGTTGNNGKITGKDQTTANTILPKTGQSFAIILGIVFIISVGVFVYIKYNKYRDI